MVTNLPKDKNPFSLQSDIDYILDKLFNKGNVNNFVKSRVIGNYDELFDLAKQIELIKLKFESYSKEDVIKINSGLRFCCCGVKVNAR